MGLSYCLVALFFPFSLCMTIKVRNNIVLNSFDQKCLTKQREREMNTQDDKFTKKSLKAVNCENKLILKIEHIRK